MKPVEKRFPANTSLDILTFLNDKKIDGELYAYLQNLSIHDGKDTFVLKKDLPIQTKICSAIGIKSPKTLRAHLDYLIEQKFVEEETDRYILPLQENIYFLIPQRTLRFLTNNCKEHIMKIYVYLGQRWKWACLRSESYTFSYKELAQHIGIYSKNNETRVNQQIKDALDLLTMAELIDYDDIYIDKVPYKKLTKFSFDYKDIKKKKVAG